jgi:hypothetical protein
MQSLNTDARRNLHSGANQSNRGAVYRKFYCVAIALALLFSISVASESAVRLAGFQAYLFNSKTGQLSQDILTKGAPELGNVPIGEFASVSTLVVVKVELGAQAPVPEKAQIRLVALQGGSLPFAAKDGKNRDRTILDRTTNLGPVNDTGASYIGFWLDNTGCHTITLKAFVVGVRDAVPLTGVLPFTCYE